MKNKCLFFATVMLFGILFPSGQAYANGKRESHIRWELFQKQKIIDDLAEKIAGSDNFAKYVICLSYIPFCLQLTKLKLNEKDKIKLDEKIVSVSTLNFDSLSVDKKNLLMQDIGLSSFEEFHKIEMSINYHKNNVLKEFKELNTLGRDDIQNLLVKAASSDKLKANVVLSLSDCSKTSTLTALRCVGIVLVGSFTSFCIVMAACVLTAIALTWWSGGTSIPFALLGCFEIGTLQYVKGVSGVIIEQCIIERFLGDILNCRSIFN